MPHSCTVLHHSLTIHKVNGLGLQSCAVSCDNLWQPDMLYSMITRAHRLERLYILDSGWEGVEVTDATLSQFVRTVPINANAHKWVQGGQPLGADPTAEEAVDLDAAADVAQQVTSLLHTAAASQAIDRLPESHKRAVSSSVSVLRRVYASLEASLRHARQPQVSAAIIAQVLCISHGNSHSRTYSAHRRPNAPSPPPRVVVQQQVRLVQQQPVAPRPVLPLGLQRLALQLLTRQQRLEHCVVLTEQRRDGDHASQLEGPAL